MAQQPPTLIGIPTPIKKRKVGDLIDGVPVLEGIPVEESEPDHPELSPVPPPELAETPEAAPSSPLSVESPRAPPPSPVPLSELPWEELLGTRAASPLVEATPEPSSSASSCEVKEVEDSVVWPPSLQEVNSRSREPSPDEVTSALRE
jgi:hypothetical protein